MRYLKTYENFDDSMKATNEMHEIRSNISDIFYELEDMDFDINVSSHSHNIYQWTHQVRIKKRIESPFSFEEVQETIERFLDYIEPYASVIPSFPGRKPIDFQVDHYFLPLRHEEKYNLSYDELLKLVNGKFKDGEGLPQYFRWMESMKEKYGTKVGDRLRTIYIQVGVNLETNESNDWDSGFTCPIFDLPKEMRDEVSDVLLELEDEGYVVTFIPKAPDDDNCPYVHILEPNFKMDGFNLEDIRDVVDRIDTIARENGWRIDIWDSEHACTITFIN